MALATRSLVGPADPALVTGTAKSEGPGAAADPPCRDTKAAATPASVAAAAIGAPRLMADALRLACRGAAGITLQTARLCVHGASRPQLASGSPGNARLGEPTGNKAARAAKRGKHADQERRVVHLPERPGRVMSSRR